MAKPKLALIPAAQGSKLFSVLPSSGVGDFDFTRSGGATRINSQGLIETVDDGVSRLNYPMIDGKVVGCPHHILEPQRTNLIQYSEDFSNAYWTKDGSSVVSGFVSPKGDLNAFKLVEGTNNGTHIIKPTAVSSNIYTLSVFAKYNGRILQLASTSTVGHYANFDLLNGVIGNFGGTTTNVTITEISNGWYRCSMTTTSNMNTAIINTVQSVTSAYQETYQGNGSSGVYIYGAQLEAGSFPTSYIPNYGTALGVTRQAETANGAGDASTFNDSEGVLMAEISALADDGTNRYISISSGALANRIMIGYSNPSNSIRAFATATTQQAFIESTSYDTTNLNKLALKYKVNDIALWINGFEVGVDTNAVMPSGINELAFDRGDGADDFYGNTKQIQYFNSALADTQLEQLTSWVSFQEMANGQLYTIE